LRARVFDHEECVSTVVERRLELTDLELGVVAPRNADDDEREEKERGRAGRHARCRCRFYDVQ
jgi:hypothetical protein